MIRIEFPADRPDIARAFGQALLEISKYERPQREPYQPAAKPVEIQSTLEETTPAPLDVTVTVAGQVIEPQPDPGYLQDNEGVTPAADVLQYDTKGVPFNRDLCAISKEPFYSSGPRAGQWKKRKGVGEDRYENWYRDAQSQLTTAPNAMAHANSSTAAQVFAKGTGATAPTETAAPPPTAGPGHLFKWLTGLQTSGQITREGVDASWRKAGLTMTDLLPPTTPAAIEQNLVALYRAIQAEIENGQ